MQNSKNSASNPHHSSLITHHLRKNNAGAFRLLRCLLLAFSFFALVFALGNLVFEKGVATDLYSLAGDDGQLIGALAQKTASEIRVLCADEERAAKCRAVFPFRESPDPARLLDFFQTHGSGLLSDKSRALLETGDYDKIRRSVKRRDYTGVGLFPKSADPFYFLSDYVASLKSLMPKGLSEGQVLLTANVKGHEGDIAKLIELAKNDDGISPSGAPFHTFLATEKSKREINILGGVSLLAVLIIGLALFRSPRFILPTASALFWGFLVGATAVFAFFPHPHILTFLFGSTLIGLGVDYCYHSLAYHGWDELPLVRDEHDNTRTSRSSSLPKTRKALTAALVTTTLAFSPLLFSSVAVLNQMATFTIAGLVTIWAFAVTNNINVPARSVNIPKPDMRRWKFAPLAVLVAYLAVLVALAMGWQRLATTNDPANFYKPPEVLSKGETKIAEIIGGVSAFTVVSAPTLEEALAKEEASGVTGVSKILPSLARQRHNAELVAKFSGIHQEQSFVTLDSLPPSLRALADAMILEHGDKIYLLAPFDAGAENKNTKIAPKEALEKMFARFSAETTLLIFASFAMMAIALAIMYRRRFFDYVTPVGVAVMMTAGVLGWMGEKITFFHTLCFFVMTGIGIDYVIFNMASFSAKGPASKLAGAMGRGSVVFASFLTSLVGFGALGFTSFPPTRAMGLTLAIGLFFCYALSLLDFHRSYPSIRRKRGVWHEQEEKGATRLGMLIIWHIYRIFGKTAAKIVFLVPLAFIAPFCHGVGFRKILAFAWSRIDIVDAVTLRKNAPRFTFTGDAAWRDGGAFLISSHLGSIEVLAALCDESKPHLHAFQQMTHDPIFTTFLTERMNGFTLHAVENIGVETAAEMQDAIRSGALVLMAGDRISASSRQTFKHIFMERECEWPKGVFRFAKLMECPVYAIIAIKTGWNAYEIKSRRLGPDLLHDYVTFLECEVRQYPDQWFQF